MTQGLTGIRVAGQGARGGNVTVLSMLGAAALTSALVSLVSINRLKDAAVGLAMTGAPVTPGVLLHALGPLDGMLALLAAVSLVALIRVQAAHGGITRFLTAASWTQAFAALTIVAAWTGHCFLSPGLLLGGDTGTHVSRFLEVARGLADGGLPTWTNYQYLGAPLLWFTGPLTYVIGGPLALVAGDPVLALKVFFFACHMASAWLFFAFMRRLDFAPAPALIAAAGFSGCFASLHMFLYRGVAPQALTIVLLVLLFHATEGVMVRRGRAWVNWLLVAVSTGGVIVNHQPHALFAAFYLVVFGGVSLLLGRWRWQGLPGLILAALCGVWMSAIAVLPVLAESDWVMIQPEGAMFGLHVPTLARIGQLLIWRDTRTTWGIDYWAYLGITLVMLGGLGVKAGLSPGPRRPLAAAACLCLGIGLFLYNPVVRDVIFLIFPLAILVGMGAEAIARRPRLLLLGAVLVLVDLASTSIQPVARTDKGFALLAGETLEHVAPNERMVEFWIGPDGQASADAGPDADPMNYRATVQRVAGNHNMAATRVHNYAISAAKMAEADFRRDRALAGTTRRLLGLFNVTRIVCQSPVASGCPASFAGTTDEPGLGRVVTIPGVPVLFSQTLATLPPPLGLDKPMVWEGDYYQPAKAPRIAAIDQFLDDFVQAEATAIAVRDPGAWPVSVAGAWHPMVRDYRVGLQTISLTIHSDGSGYAQIAHPWFPATGVFVDGQAVQSLQGSTGLLVIPIGPGQHLVEIRPMTTPIRRIAGWLSVTGLLAALAGAAWMALFRRPSPLR